MDKKFSKMLTKNDPFDFHCSKGADKNLRVRIKVILSGTGVQWGCGYKMVRPQLTL